MGEGDAEGEQQVNGVESPTSEGEDILIAPIQVIINQSVYSSEYESDEDEELEKKKKRTKKSKKKGGKTQPDKTMILTKTFAQAIRLINEQKERERQKLKQEQIRALALEQKAKRENMGRPQVIIHI